MAGLMTALAYSQLNSHSSHSDGTTNGTNASSAAAGGGGGSLPVGALPVGVWRRPIYGSLGILMRSARPTPLDGTSLRLDRCH